MNTRTEFGLTVEGSRDRATITYNMGTVDLLTTRTAQLRSLLVLFSGEERDILIRLADEHQNCLGWLAADLANEVHLLSSIVAEGRAA